MVLKPRILAPNWKGDADGNNQGKCMFVTPDPGNDPFFEDMDWAIAICNGDIDGVVCPIRHKCLIFALINNEADGIWGGTYPHDRKRIRHTVERRNWQWEPPTPKPEDLPPSEAA